jgi:DNA-binding NtrC family response regulator
MDSTRAPENLRLLIVDDDAKYRNLVGVFLTEKGSSFVEASNGETALALLAKTSFDMVLLDLAMPGLDGIEVLKRIKAEGITCKVVMLTGSTEIENAVEAMKAGAWDFLTKPCKFESLEAMLDKLSADKMEKQGSSEKSDSSEELRLELSIGPLIIGSKAMRRLAEITIKVASSELAVIIVGESGTGKELFARLLHEKSSRRSGPFIASNCANIQGPLAERELFGHEKGAFTDARESKPGLLECADKGTLFLDEVAEMPLDVQAKFLRVLETGLFRRLGDTCERSVDIRIVAATNKNLIEMTVNGSFRGDLFYRLRGVQLFIPPLRTRPEEIKLFAAHFLDKSKRFSKDALEALKKYSWPGNVRELKNVVHEATLFADEDVITPADLNFATLSPDQVCDASPGLLKNVERLHIVELLKQNGNNKAKTARVLGIDKSTLYRKMKEYEIPLA